MIVEKGWGHEEVFASTDKYCGKLLVFKTGGQSSMHFHLYKDETWRCLTGRFTVQMLDTDDAKMKTFNFIPGGRLHVASMVPHRIICHESGTILEVSTPDSAEDNYRIAPGDSQLKTTKAKGATTE